MVSVLPSMDHTFSSMVDLKEQSVLDHQVKRQRLDPERDTTQHRCEVPAVSSPASHSDSGCASPSEGSGGGGGGGSGGEVLAPLVNIARGVSMAGSSAATSPAAASSSVSSSYHQSTSGGPPPPPPPAAQPAPQASADPAWLTPTSIHHNNNTLLEVKGEPSSSNTAADVFTDALPPYTPASENKSDLSSSHLQQLYSSTMQAYGGNSYMQPPGFYNTMPNSQYSYGSEYLIGSTRGLNQSGKTPATSTLGSGTLGSVLPGLYGLPWIGK
ncbi:protein fork head-like, partial [Penaeus monodon]|uniref:protein fork head-like n=1 Tax=Penaeus monodon TaxID=6687 RepID=UPI0018A7A23D